MALWRAMKRELTGPHGRAYFEASVKGAGLPTLYGTLVSGTPADHPSKFLVAMADNSEPEITLNLNGNLEKPLARGTPVRFDGVATSFTAEPFMLFLDVESVNRATLPSSKDR